MSEMVIKDVLNDEDIAVMMACAASECSSSSPILWNANMEVSRSLGRFLFAARNARSCAR